MIDRLALILLLAGSMLFGAIFAAELTAPYALGLVFQRFPPLGVFANTRTGTSS